MKKIKQTLFLLLLLSTSFFLQAAVENPVYEWLKNDGTKMVDMIYYDHHIYTLGDNLKKWDTSGNQIWMKPISGIDLDIDNNGNLVLANNFNTPNITIANTTLINNGGYDFYIAKVDTAGNVIWAKNYGGAGTDKAGEICVDYANNIYINGVMQSFTGIIKYTDTGNQIWSKAIADVNSRMIRYSAFDSTIVLTGYFNDTFHINNLQIIQAYGANNSTNTDLYLAKINTNGVGLYLQNITMNYHSEQFQGNMYVNKKDGHIFIPYLQWGLLGNSSRIIEYNTSCIGLFTQFQKYVDFGIGHWLANVFGNEDSLITAYWYTQGEAPPYDSENKLFIKNAISNQTINEYYYHHSLGYYGYRILWGENQKFIIYGSNIPPLVYFAKFGDTSMPLSIFNVHDDTVCSDVYFNTGYIINSGKPPYTVSWSPTTGLGNPNVLNPGFYLDTTTTYIITLTDSNNTVIHDTVTFTVYPTPHDSMTVTGNPIFCYGSTDSIQLSCSLPGFVNKWTSNVLGVIATDTSIIWAHPNNIYTLTTTDTTSGCYSTDAINLNVYNKQAIIVDTSLTEYGDSLVKCNSTDSLLLKNKNATIPTSRLTWYRNGVLIDSNKQSIKIGSTGQYVLKNTDIYCVNEDTLNVIYSNIVLHANSSSNPACEHDSIVLHCTGAPLIYWNNGVIDSVKFPASQTVSYQITGSDLYGCSSSTYYLQIVNPSYDYSISTNICEGNSFTFPDGYTVQNATTDITRINNYHTVKGCDSIEEYTLFVHDTAQHTHKYNIGCKGEFFTLPNGAWVLLLNDTTVTSHFYTTNGGCDSLVYTHIDVIEDIDSTITPYRNYLESNELNAAYQWVDCDNNKAYISGETNRLFFPKRKGNYAVQVNKSGCVVTSKCYSILAHDSSEIYATVYPNPASDILFVEYFTSTDARLILFNSVGQTILETALPSDRTKIQININDIASGLYYYHIDMNERKSYEGKLLIR